MEIILITTLGLYTLCLSAYCYNTNVRLKQSLEFNQNLLKVVDEFTHDLMGEVGDLDDKIITISNTNDRSFMELRATLEHIKNRFDDSCDSRKPQANNFNSLKEAFKIPVKSVDINERS